jgi:DNA polymerase III delta subunit
MDMNPSALPGRLAKEKGGVYFLFGEDEFLKVETGKALVEHHLDPGTRDFNLDQLRGSEVSVEQLASVIATPPLMAEWRVVLLSEVEALASNSRARDILLNTVRTPPEGLALVLLASIPNKSKARFYKDLQRGSKAMEFRGVGPNDVPGWLISWTRQRHGREMDLDAARALGSAVGTDLGVLAQEVEKLVSVVEEGCPIGMDAVRAAGTNLPVVDRWNWFDRVGEREFGPALTDLGTLLQQGESGVGLTAGLTTQLLRVGLALTGGSPGLEESLGPHQRWLVPRLLQQARKWSTEELNTALLGLRRLDRLLKSSSLSEDLLLEEWLLGLMAQKEETVQ